MKLIFKLLFLFILIESTNLYAQDLGKIDVNNLSNSQIESIHNKMKDQNISMDDLERKAIADGMTPTDFQILKVRLGEFEPTTNNEQKTTLPDTPIQMDASGTKVENKIFGHNLFNSKTLTFEPNPNLRVPPTYKLVVGDKLHLSIYGVQIFNDEFTVTKEGTISIPNIGQIYVMGLTFEAAKDLIHKRCSTVYSTLKSGQSKMSLTVQGRGSIRVTIIGAETPGTYTMGSFSTVFHALHASGGPNGNGTYRNIELIRDNKVYKVIDVYKFLMTGSKEEDYCLEDNDIIRIPTYVNRVSIEGKVRRSGIFELKQGEDFNDLLNYALGFDEGAYVFNIKIIQNTDRQMKILDLNQETYSKYVPKNGDIIKVSTILNNYENKITIVGAVVRPDDYELTEGMRISDLIKKADGFREDVFLNKAMLIRKKDDLTLEYISINLNNLENSSNNIELKKDDHLSISSIFDIKAPRFVKINGMVKEGGQYPFAENLTLYDVILMAGAFKEGASNKVEISRRIKSNNPEDISDDRAISFTVYIDTNLIDQTSNIKLQPYDIISVRKMPFYETQKTVQILGEVIYPGNYTLINENELITDLLKRAGSFTKYAELEGLKIVRKVDRAGTIRDDNQTINIPLDYSKISKRRYQRKYNLTLEENDVILVPKIRNTVLVFGNIDRTSEVPYKKFRGLKYYVNSSGGFNDRPYRKKIYVIKTNGITKPTRNFLFLHFYPRIKPGYEIVIPKRPVEVNNETSDPKLDRFEMMMIMSVLSTVSATVLGILRMYQE